MALNQKNTEVKVTKRHDINFMLQNWTLLGEILNHSSQHFYYFAEHEKIKILWEIIKRIWPSQTGYGFYSEREKSFYADMIFAKFRKNKKKL